jgi:hypothetical protein
MTNMDWIKGSEKQTNLHKFKKFGLIEEKYLKEF